MSFKLSLFVFGMHIDYDIYLLFNYLLFLLQDNNDMLMNNSISILSAILSPAYFGHGYFASLVPFSLLNAGRTS